MEEESREEEEESEVSEERSEYTEEISLPSKIFNICKIPKQNLSLMRNKIPKVFWINKVKQSKFREYSEGEIDDDEDSFKKEYRDFHRNEKQRSFRRKIAIRPMVSWKIQNRTTNEYSSHVKFKIEKIKRQLIKPFSLKRYPNKQKICDVISTSTKRSSRESSKNKIKSLRMLPPLQISKVNLIKIENNEEIKEYSNKIEFEHKPIDREINQIDFLKADMHAFKFEEQFDEEIEIPKAIINQVNVQMQLDSISSYHDHELDQAYKEASKVLKYHNMGNANHELRQRGLSGWNDFDVIEVHEDNSFLFSNERDTLHFEPFIAKNYCHNGFDFKK